MDTDFLAGLTPSSADASQTQPPFRPGHITLSCAACAAFRAGPNERCVMRILT